MSDTPTITCPRCGATSAHPVDIAEGYCGHCRDWTTPKGGLPPSGEDARLARRDLEEDR